MEIIIFAVYLLCSVGGMLLVKLGSGNTMLALDGGQLQFKMPLFSILGLCLYIISFILWMVLINVADLSYIVPIGMGLSQVLIIAAAALILKEDINTYQWVGIFVVTTGIVLLNIKK